EGDADAAEQDLGLAPAVIQHVGWHLSEPAKQLAVGGPQCPVAALHLVERNYHGLPRSRARVSHATAQPAPSCKPPPNPTRIRVTRRRNDVMFLHGFWATADYRAGAVGWRWGLRSQQFFAARPSALRPDGVIKPELESRRRPSALCTPSEPPAAWQWSCTTASRWDTP